MLNEAILVALNIQMSKESLNSYRYRSFAGVADSLGMTNTTKMFNDHADEEHTHFRMIFDYVCDKGHVPTLLAIPEQKPEGSVIDLLKTVMDAELETTDSLRMIALLCKEICDDQTYHFIIKMLDIQIQEEKEAQDLFLRATMSSGNMLVFDRSLAG